MVGIVIVSHSAKLAEGVAELALGMAGPDARLVAVGGLDLPGRPLGTDGAMIERAIRQAYSDDGVLVLMDLGSALLSAEMALEMFAEAERAHIQLCEAPLVEGALAAAVQARFGGSLAQVAEEARAALTPKIQQLGGHHAAPVSLAAPAAVSATARRLELVVRNRLGLHARPAARVVQTASRFPATLQLINVTTGQGPASAKSLNGVATLGVRQGQTLAITAEGPQAEEALAALAALAEANFGDVDEAPVSRPAQPVADSMTPSASGIAGLPAAPGLAVGPARRLTVAALDIPDTPAADPAAEWERLQGALDHARLHVQAMLELVRRRADAATAEIFEAHLLFLEDEALLTPARQAIFEGRANAAAAWRAATQAAAAQFRALEDEYQRARAVDVEDVGRQVIAHLLGVSTVPALSAPGILVAADLTPADTAALDPSLVYGLATAFGGPTSHSAILARSLGLPAVVGLGAAALALADGTPLILDGDAGRLIPNPDAALVEEYTRRQAEARRAAEGARAARTLPAVTRDGRRIEVVANIGSAADARAAIQAGAEGVGLFRTEFLFLDRQTAPDEAEQYAAYRAAAEVIGHERPLIIRTLDVGGDKPLPYVTMSAEANPFLGQRAVRLCLARPDFFKVQLRAIARVAAEFSVKVMFPMIATLAEYRAARALLQEAAAEVRRAGGAAPERIETGIMVEIPSAALQARQFAAEVDFFSIGTNDLTQYTLAAERGNAEVAALADAFQPAVLELIRLTAEAAHAHGKWAGVCGELAGDPRAVSLLVGLGIDELSMSAPAIPRAKEIVRGLDYAVARERALAALTRETPDEVRAGVA